MTDTDDRFSDLPDHADIAGYEPRFVDVDGIRTRYYDLGSGEPLVLVHGGDWSGKSSANTWSTNFEGLADRFRVIAFDRVGCGMTDNPETVDDYRYRTDFTHALSVLDTLGIDRCHIAGISRGGGLALRMAVEDPDRFETLVVVNSATFGPPSGDEDFRRDRVFDQSAPDVEPTDPEATRQFLYQYCYQTDHITDEYCRLCAYMRSLPKAQETAEIMQEQGRLDHWKETMREQMTETYRRIGDGVLTVPVLYTYGRNDLTVPIEMVTAAYDMLAQENPDVRLTVFNESGHLVYREHPEEWNRTVIDFIDYWG